MSAPLTMRAAIFDLDGTLLDSMYVWHAVDERFFAERGLTLTPDYGKAIAGMSYRETALYTKKRYGLTEREGEIMIMFAKGRNLPYVQEELCLSKSTVSTHRQHIYQKLGVHSSQEMIDLIQEENG